MPDGIPDGAVRLQVAVQVPDAVEDGNQVGESACLGKRRGGALRQR